MSGPDTWALVAGVVVDTAVHSTVAFTGAALFSRLWPGSASQRHGAWLMAFTSVPALAALHASNPVALSGSGLGQAWLCGAAIAAMPLLSGLAELPQLWRSGVPAELSGVPVRLSAQVRAPLTWGWPRPQLLFPDSAAEWSSEDLRAAFVHEQAHQARRDWLVHVGSWLVCALLWFHPLSPHRLATGACRRRPARAAPGGMPPRRVPHLWRNPMALTLLLALLSPVLAAPMQPTAVALDDVTADLAYVLENLDSGPLSIGMHEELQERGRRLIVTCPFNRSAVQVPLVLQARLSRFDDPALDDLKQALDQHVALLEVMGLADLPRPPKGSWLAQLDPADTPTRADLGGDAVVRTHRLLEAVSELIPFPHEVLPQVEDDMRFLRDATSQGWSFANQFEAYELELQTLHDQLDDPAFRDEAAELVLLIAAFRGRNC